MKNVILNGVKYEIIRNDKDCFNKEEVEEKITDYFDPYDYIFGDYAYEKIRLKGYYESNNKNVNKINDIKNLDDYIKNYCSYGSKTFLLKKIK
ncbi:MAG: YutD family protein [Bacilli bacterium]|nr:YutD family protein [Bacilli bacterium]